MGNTQFKDLNQELINPLTDGNDTLLKFEATTNSHGSYETNRFVLRLSPRVHELLDQFEFNQFTDGTVPWENVQAYSTYIHETIHWWQHIGSTSGFLLSLSYFGQCHSSIHQLKNVINEFGPIKPLKGWTDSVLLEEGQIAQDKLASANYAVNNALDVFYYTKYVLNPRACIGWLKNQIHFEDVGYSYCIAYAQLISLLADEIDHDLKFLPNLDRWGPEIERLVKQKYVGFSKGSEISLPSIGIQAIYEGQARFIQLEYLNRVRTQPLTSTEWRQEGYLSGIYVEAFECFLKHTKSDWPSSISDPIVSLFLLVCDISINPTRGFPLDIIYFEDFIHDVDVGRRFNELCFIIEKKPYLKEKITHRNREEYINVSSDLIEDLGYDHPLSALEKIINWEKEHDSVRELLNEYDTFNFKARNINIRVLLAHFIEYSKDKFQNPHFFCWAGSYLAQGSDDSKVLQLWMKHLSLFTDTADLDGIYPRNWPNRSEESIKIMFEKFYSSMAIYELTQQWILHDGDFKCNFKWMSDNYNQEIFSNWANETFKKIYGVNLKDFKIFKF